MTRGALWAGPTPVAATPACPSRTAMALARQRGRLRKRRAPAQLNRPHAGRAHAKPRPCLLQLPGAASEPLLLARSARRWWRPQRPPSTKSAVPAMPCAAQPRARPRPAAGPACWATPGRPVPAAAPSAGGVERGGPGPLMAAGRTGPGASPLAPRAGIEPLSCRSRAGLSMAPRSRPKTEAAVLALCAGRRASRPPHRAWRAGRVRPFATGYPCRRRGAASRAGAAARGPGGSRGGWHWP
jgi:hypothetical protein